MAETTSEAPERAVSPVGVNHLVLNVHDIDESHQFWTEVLGFHQVGELKPRTDGIPSMKMRFYSGNHDGEFNHHDVALVEMPGLVPKPEEWSMFQSPLAVNHIAIHWPDREAWLEQIRFMQSKGVKFELRINHGMTHSAYISDPNGYGIEVLYELPRDVWGPDIDGALNHAELLPTEGADALEDDTNYKRDFATS